jgi:hypothetical protein
MPLFEACLTVSVSGTVRIEAADLDAAREAAENISGLTCDVSLTGGEEFHDDLMFPEVDLDGIECIDEPIDEDDEGPQ